MKIGILLCGDVPITLINEFGSYSACLQSQYELNKFGDVSVYNVYQHQTLYTLTSMMFILLEEVHRVLMMI